MNNNKHISDTDVIAGHFTGGGYVFYHLPDDDNYTFLSQQGRPNELAALDVSDSFQGFVIAPFAISESCPLILMEPDFSKSAPLSLATAIPQQDIAYLDDEEERRAPYGQSFKSCHQTLLENKTRKIVLSRRLQLKNTSDTPWDAVHFFFKACRAYPHNFVSLWWTERTGCWLVATPETLLKRTEDEHWQTMALAGTMKWEECQRSGFDQAWSIKNKEEQQYVTTYIEHRLRPYVQSMTLSPTYTSQAADLAHLRTDFTFRLKAHVHLGKILQQLHPTPAVCGVPQDIASHTILKYEDSPRKYYAGFSGPVNWEGNSQLYVSLRCMELAPRKALLYAGGGLLKDSNENEEWTETQRKMQTMLRLF